MAKLINIDETMLNAFVTLWTDTRADKIYKSL